MGHIGIDARLTTYRVGGISSYTTEMIRALERCQPAHHISILHSRKSPYSTNFNAVPLWTPPHFRFEKIALALELTRLGLDLLHTTDFIPPSWGAKHQVITVHDLTFLHYPEHKDQAAIRYYNDQIERAVQKAAHILAVSEATHNDLVTMLKVNPDKITVQPHGINLCFQPLVSESVKTQLQTLGLPQGYILFVGTLEPRKNIPALLDAYEQLDQPPLLLLVGRPGWLFDATMQRIERLQARGHPIIIRSDIPNAQLPVIYNGAHVLILPSFYEGFGMPALEAMACGTPVIVSDTSSLPEVVGDVGLLINPNDPDTLIAALNRALNDLEWREQARDAGIQRAKQFTWERSAQIALSTYETVLSTRT